MQRTQLEILREQREELKRNVVELVPAPDADDETRNRYTQDDDTRAGEILAQIAELDDSIAGLEQLENRQMIAATLRAELNQGGAHVTREPLTYTAETARRDGVSFIVDAYRAQYRNDYRAQERIARHQREMETEYRDLTTAQMGGLITPVFLQQQYAGLAYAGRPIANTVNRQPLPPQGMTLSIPQAISGTAVKEQAAQNVPLIEQDLNIGSLNVPVITVGGQQDVSRQALERGTGTDEIIFADLVNNYAVAVDNQVIRGTGAAGQALGIMNTAGLNAVTYTSGAPTAGELWGKLADAAGRVQAARFLPPTVIYMHPRRWAFITAALGSDGRPLVNAVNAQNALGVGDALQYGQVVGNIQGLPVVTDATIATNLGAGTNEDMIIVARSQDLLLWEDSAVPRELRFEETSPGSLTVKLVVYGYVAFTAGRYPASVSTITGTGLVPPTF